MSFRYMYHTSGCTTKGLKRWPFQTNLGSAYKMQRKDNLFKLLLKDTFVTSYSVSLAQHLQQQDGTKMRHNTMCILNTNKINWK